jgi:transposase
MANKFINFPIRRILELSGMVINFTEISNDGKFITVFLNKDKRIKKSYCGGCGKKAGRERRIQRTLRDLPLTDKTVYLKCQTYIVKCSNCNGFKREKLDFIDKCSKNTIRFETFIYELISMSTVAETADKYHMTWDAAKNIDKKYLEARFSKVDYGDLKYISMDEVSNKKGQDYLSTVMNLETGKVIWVGEGRKEEDIDKFYETLSKTQKSKIKAISIDMWSAYIKSAKKNCPDADIVFDKFHVIKNYGEVLIKLRSAEYKKALKAGEKKNQEILKGAKWLLLKRKSKLSREKKKQLDELLELNENLSKAYMVTNKLKHFL